MAQRPWVADSSVFLLYTLLSVVFTWPLVSALAELAPAHFDPPFTAWRLGWIAHQLGHPGHLFDGNIFYPDRRTLAYSDAVLLQGVLGAPLIALGVKPNGIANVLILVALVASAFFAYLLAARLTGHRGAAIVAGLVFAFSSYRRVHLPHLELQWAQWMPLAFWAWHRLLDTGRMRDGLLCAAPCCCSCCRASTTRCSWGSAWRSSARSRWWRAAAGWRRRPRRAVRRRGDRRRRGGVVRRALRLRPARVGDRTIEETPRYSATPGSFLTASPDNIVYRPVLPHDGEGETELFPGVTPVVLAGAALVPPATAAAVAYGLSLVGVRGHGARAERR